MSGFGSYSRSAVKERPQNMLSKIAQVEKYILDKARQRKDRDPNKVRCPSREEWGKLAAGRRPILPSVTVLQLYADEEMRLAARLRRNGYRGAYFAAAQANIQEKRV